jgi:hypothetical protein
MPVGDSIPSTEGDEIGNHSGETPLHSQSQQSLNGCLDYSDRTSRSESGDSIPSLQSITDSDYGGSMADLGSTADSDSEGVVPDLESIADTDSDGLMAPLSSVASTGPGGILSGSHHAAELPVSQTRMVLFATGSLLLPRRAMIL